MHIKITKIGGIKGVVCFHKKYKKREPKNSLKSTLNLNQWLGQFDVSLVKLGT